MKPKALHRSIAGSGAETPQTKVAHSTPLRSLSAQAIDRLGREIVAGHFASTQSLPPEPQLCDTLGVSRTVVREAVKALIAKGLIVSGPKLGTRVLPRDQWNWFDADVVRWSAEAGLSLPLLRDLHELRRVVEPAAVRLAAERAQADDLRAMEDALMAMTRAAEMAEAADAMLRRRPSRGMRESREALAAAGRDYVAADLRFHQALLGASHNQMMKQVGRALAPLLAMSFEMSSDHAQGAIGSLPMHRRVLDAVRARKPDAAARASLVLIDDAGADIERKHGPRHAPTQVK